MGWTKESQKSTSWFKEFLKEQKVIFLIFFLQATCFATVFFLADLPLFFYWYALQVGFFLFFLLMVFQAFRYRKKWLALKRLSSSSLDVLLYLDGAETAIEKQYEQEIIRLAKEIRQLKKENSNQLTDQLDYFTLWLHQIKTPIASLSLLFQQSRSANPEVKEMEKELIRIEDYTQMALGYMKLEQPGEELDIGREALDPIIKQVLKKYALMFISKKITLKYEPLETVIVTDRQWLELLIELLVSNSLKYTPERVNVSIYLEQNDQLIIQDNGIGIRKEDLPKIFERGYSGWNARRIEKSTGLGLFLGRKICRRLGYKLSIQSEINQGTTIQIDLNQKRFQTYD